MVNSIREKWNSQALLVESLRCAPKATRRATKTETDPLPILACPGPAPSLHFSAMTLRRLTGYLTALVMLHLTVVAGDAACAMHVGGNHTDADNATGMPMPDGLPAMDALMDHAAS